MIHSILNESAYLCLDEKSIKIIKTRLVSRKKVIADLHYKNIEGLAIEAVVAEIKAGMAALGFKSRRVTLLLPAKYAITKNVEVPSLDKEEIENIVRLQAVRHTPYSREEVIVSHINLDVILEGYTKVLLVIVSNESLRRRTDLLTVAGYEIEAVHFSSEALVRMLGHYETLAPEAPCGLTYIDMDSTDFVIVKNGKPYFIRSIPIGAKHLKQDPAVGQQLIDELKKTCEAYLGEEQGAPLTRFLLAGVQSPALSNLSGLIKEHFQVQPEELFAESKLPITPEAKTRLAQWNHETAFLDIFGVGLESENLSIDLLPEDLKVKKSFRNKGRDIFTVAMFVMLIFVMVVGIFLAKIYFRSHYLGDLSRTFELKQKEAEELDLLSEQTRLARAFKLKRGRALKVLDELQTDLPSEMYLSEIVLDSQPRLTIKGTSTLMSTVFSFVTEFENHPYFKNVTSDYTKSRKENEKDVSDFGISATVEEVLSDGGG